MSVNITVDDTFGNSDRTVTPTYIPDNATWHHGTPSEQCDICVIKPSMLDTNQIVNQTWHHAMYFIGIPIQVKVSFPGTAVYVYNVLPNTLPNDAAMTVNISFALDGETVGHFFRVPDTSNEILYHQLVYANTSLPDGPHMLIMSASGSDPSLIFFDYLLYTTEADETTTAVAAAPSGIASSATTSSANPPSISSSTHIPTGVIVGGVIGGVALLFLGAALLFFCFRRPRRMRLSIVSSDSIPQDAALPLMSTSEQTVWPLSISPLSDVATVTSSSPGLRSSSAAILSCPTKRQANVLHPNPRPDTMLMPVHSSLPQDQGQPTSLERRPEPSTSERLSSGAVQELQGEIAALRDVLRAMATTVTASGGLHAEVDMSDPPPGYEEARGDVHTSRNAK